MADINKFELGGVTKFEMGDVGANGVMGSVLTQYLGIKEGTFTFSIAAPSATDINIEESDFAYTQQLSGSPKSFSFELFGLHLSELPKFLGGTFTAGVGGTKDKWEAPSAIPSIFQSIAITSVDSDGNVGVYSYVKCRIYAEQTQTTTKTDLVGLQVTASILQPVDASGNPTTPYYVEGEQIA